MSGLMGTLKRVQTRCLAHSEALMPFMWCLEAIFQDVIQIKVKTENNDNFSDKLWTQCAE